MKTYKGEKYIYLLMGFKLCKSKEYIKEETCIGYDNGFKGGNQFYREFKIQEYKGKTLLVETKLSKGFADFSRTFEVFGDDKRPIIQDYINEDGENCANSWTH